MNLELPSPASSSVSRLFIGVFIAVILVLFAVRNLPWHLDDLDQAKQAFVSYDMVENNHWLIQNTPRDEIATKPPLQGWMSAGLYLVAGGHGWEIAWRLPVFVAALLILRQLWRTGGELYGNAIGSILAAGTFALNSYVPRLATLVRTDMLLATFIFFTGWIILEKLRTGAPWTWKDRLATCLLLLGSTLTKGPIAYAFLLPGIIVYLLLARKRELPRDVFCGWLWWILPLALFGVWLILGLNVPGFKEQVIYKEFLGRFSVGASAQHHNSYPGDYTVHLVGLTLPWSALFVALLAALLLKKSIRRILWDDHLFLWLACWAVGGLVFMEFVPSKRFDRILPVLPPLALLLARAARHLPDDAVFGWPRTRLVEGIAIAGMFGACGYTAAKIIEAHRNHARVLVQFGEKVRSIVKDNREQLAIVHVRDEGLLMYCGARRYTGRPEAVRLWENGQIDWMIVGKGDFEKLPDKFRDFEIMAETPTLPEKADEYRLLRRVANQQLPGVSIPNSNSAPSRRTEKARGAPDWHPPSKLQ
jgi:4-amino-4-deoxy-L-arabinose transferase-like glycosyltransferase